jgi:hypothetical protein
MTKLSELSTDTRFEQTGSWPEIGYGVRAVLCYAETPVTRQNVIQREYL